MRIFTKDEHSDIIPAFVINGNFAAVFYQLVNL